MARNKPAAMKARLMKKLKQNRRVPAWVMMRTERAFLRPPMRRHWRHSKITE